MSEEQVPPNPSTPQPAPEGATPVPPPTVPAASAATLSESDVQSKKILAGVLGIVLGGFGVHKFILGYKTPGFIMLGVAVLGWLTMCLGVGAFIYAAIGIVGLIEGIMYLTKSNEEFRQTYLVGKKEWF